MPRLVSLITVLLLGLASALLLLTAGCNRAKQADNSEQSTPVAQQGAQSARSGRLVDEQNLPGGEEGDQATAGEAQESGTEAEAGSSDEEDEAAEGEDQQNGDDEGDESVDENGDGSGEDEGGEGTQPGEEPEPSEPGDETDGEEGNEEDEPPAPNPDIDAAAIYQAAMCADCHGGELDGTQRGPSLKNLDKYWDAVELGQFLKSPAYYSEGNQRLIDLAHQYNIAMPPLHRSDDEIYALAHWLLNQ
jgi:cytochrome c551/c552